MLKEVVLSLGYIVLDKNGKESKKYRRLNQVRMDLTDTQAKQVMEIMTLLTGESYISSETIETKLV